MLRRELHAYEPRCASPVFERQYCVRTSDKFGRAHWDDQISRTTDASRRHTLAATCARIDVLTAHAIELARELAHGETPRRRGRARPPHAQDHADLLSHLRRLLLHTHAYSDARNDPALRQQLGHSRVRARAEGGGELLSELVQALKEREQAHTALAMPVDATGSSDSPASDSSNPWILPVNPATENENVTYLPELLPRPPVSTKNR